MIPTKKIFLGGAAALVIFIVLYLLFKKRPVSSETLTEIFNQRAISLGLDMPEIISDSIRVYESLGIDMMWDESWFPIKVPAPWEDETTVVNTVKKYDTQAKFSLFADVYDRKFRRKLREDLNKYLSEKDLMQIPQI